MKITIITATYNSAKTIESCMTSVLNQSYPDIEYLIIDGASTDGTLKCIEPFKLQHKNLVLTSEPDRGIYDALNKGISKATGDIIGFVHSDDILSNPNIVKDIVAHFKKTNCDGVYGDLEYVKKENSNTVLRYWKSSVFKPSLLKKGWMPAHPTLYLKKDIYERFGGFNTQYKIAADYDFILRVFKNKQLKFIYLPKVIVKMRIGGASNKSLNNILLKMREDYRALKHNKVGGIGALFIKNSSKLKQFFN